MFTTTYSLTKRSLTTLLLALVAMIAMGQGMTVLHFTKDGVGEGKTWTKTYADMPRKPYTHVQGNVSVSIEQYLQHDDYGQIKKSSALTLSVSTGTIDKVHIIYDSKSKSANNKYNASSFGGKGTYDPATSTWTANPGENVTELILKNTKGVVYLSSFVINQHTYEMAIGEKGYATCALPFAYKMPTGLQGSPALGVSDGAVTFDWRYATDKVVPANTPLVLKGAAATYSLVETDATTDVATPTTNLLVANATAAAQTLNEANTVYYGLGTGTDGNYGFYKTSASGDNITLPAYRCALAMPAGASAPSPSFLSLDGMVTAIAITKITPAQPATVYNLQGQCVGTMATWQCLPKGIYIVGGQKVVK